MATNVRVVFDRRKRVEATGKGNVEIIIQLSRLAVKKIIVDTITPEEWENFQHSPLLTKEVENYQKIANAMELLGEAMTVDNFNKHIGVITMTAEKRKEIEEQNTNPIKGNFIEFMKHCIDVEQSRETTKRQKYVAVDALLRWEGIITFEDLTVKKLKEFDTWLREDGTRTDVAVYNYHKRIKLYTRLAYERGYIEKDPYDIIKFPRGKCKERKPLSESELKKMREIALPLREDKVRDLFIFASYTGLAFCDTQEFDFFTMTEQIGNLFYIDGSRMKTGTNFFTPILPPAMEVLKKYNFNLPKISNQKANESLHLIEFKLGLNKPITFHIARHSFATLSLSHDVPIEKVARMLGHKDIKTTQIYAKILKSTVANHASDLAKAII